MGYAVTWLAVRGERANDMLAALSLVRTGTLSDEPDAHWSTVRLTSGWQLIWCNDYECPALSNDRLATFSADTEVVVCKIEEHVMASSAELWSDGRVVWSISHDGEDGPEGLEVAGRPPEGLDSIRRELEAAQAAEGGSDADVDYIFEVPLRVAQEITGFKHDENYDGAIDGRFEVLEAPGRKKNLFSRLFG
jgi:hypothetical protein